MAKIAFVMDVEEGHLLPSFGLAHSLKERGHTVCYLSILENEELVQQQGFDFYPAFENIYEKGYKEKYRKNTPPPGPKPLSITFHDDADKYIYELMDGRYDAFIAELNADIFVISTFLKIDTLILYYKYNIRPVIFTPFLRRPKHTPAFDGLEYLKDMATDDVLAFVDFVVRQGVEFDSLEQLVEPLDSFCELLVCPRELEMDNSPVRPNAHYVGPSIRHGGHHTDIRETYGIEAGKKIIYASMGSQPVRHGTVCDLFFGKVTAIMKDDLLQDFHLVLSVGPEFNVDKLKPLPANTTVVRWVSQIDILQVASLAIIHGGLGSVKECIYHGVPMVVFPLGYDQPHNAACVSFHNLGLDGNIETVTEQQLKAQVLYVLNSELIATSTRAMQQLFREKEAAQPGAVIIEGLLSKVNQLAAL